MDLPLGNERDTDSCRLTDDQVQEVVRIQCAIREGKAKFATDEEMASLWRSCGLQGCEPCRPEQ
jgi:hypothetical protein